MSTQDQQPHPDQPIHLEETFSPSRTQEQLHGAYLPSMPAQTEEFSSYENVFARRPAIDSFEEHEKWVHNVFFPYHSRRSRKGEIYRSIWPQSSMGEGKSAITPDKGTRKRSLNLSNPEQDTTNQEVIPQKRHKRSGPGRHSLPGPQHAQYTHQGHSNVRLAPIQPSSNTLMPYPPFLSGTGPHHNPYINPALLGSRLLQTQQPTQSYYQPHQPITYGPYSQQNISPHVLPVPSSSIPDPNAPAAGGIVDKRSDYPQLRRRLGMGEYWHVGREMTVNQLAEEYGIPREQWPSLRNSAKTACRKFYKERESGLRWVTEWGKGQHFILKKIMIPKQFVGDTGKQSRLPLHIIQTKVAIGECHAAWRAEQTDIAKDKVALELRIRSFPPDQPLIPQTEYYTQRLAAGIHLIHTYHPWFEHHRAQQNAHATAQQVAGVVGNAAAATGVHANVADPAMTRADASLLLDFSGAGEQYQQEAAEHDDELGSNSMSDTDAHGDPDDTFC